jgi:hypothetical protein
MKKTLIAIVTSLTIICASLYLYAKFSFPINGVTRKIGEDTISPDGKYRLADYVLAMNPYALFLHDDDIVFSRVYSVKTGECLGASTIYGAAYRHPTVWPDPEYHDVSPAYGIKIPVPVK